MQPFILSSLVKQSVNADKKRPPLNDISNSLQMSGGSNTENVCPLDTSTFKITELSTREAVKKKTRDRDAGALTSYSIDEEEEEEDEEEHPLVKRMKEGDSAALVDAVLQLGGHQVHVLSVENTDSSSYRVLRNGKHDAEMWHEGGVEEITVLDPYEGKWSVIGRRSKRGRFTMKKRSAYVPGSVRATGWRQGSLFSLRKRSQRGKKMIETKMSAAAKRKRATYCSMCMCKIQGK